jgi:mannose-6-phosphate isomerase
LEFPIFEPSAPKTKRVEIIRAHLEADGFHIAEIDETRPWGAFLRVANQQADKFIAAYFDGVDIPEKARHGERSPKILLVAPHQRLSWQYHDRRAELWRAARGAVGVYVSETDAQPSEFQVLRAGDTIAMAQGTRHRLVGLDDWGAVAEIWIHVDPQNPSNEDDIHRLQDDYER